MRERIARYRKLTTQLSDERALRALSALCADYEVRLAAAEHLVRAEASDGAGVTGDSRH
jgi:hypothetical protein